MRLFPPWSISVGKSLEESTSSVLLADCHKLEEETLCWAIMLHDIKCMETYRGDFCTNQDSVVGQPLLGRFLGAAEQAHDDGSPKGWIEVRWNLSMSVRAEFSLKKSGEIAALYAKYSDVD